MEAQNSSDELDIGVLFSRIGRGIRNMWLTFIRFLAIVRRTPLENKSVFILVITGSAIIGVAYGVLQKKKYESSMILSSDYLNQRLMENAIKKLNALAGEPTKNGLAIALNLPDSLADHIIAFKAVPYVDEEDVVDIEILKEQLKTARGGKDDRIIDEVIERIELENRHAYEITVTALSASVIPNLQNSIVTFFRDNDYVRKRIELNKQNLENKKTKLSNDLAQLDSLKRAIYASYNLTKQQREGSNNVILADKTGSNPMDVFKQDLFIYEELQEVNKELFLRPDFEVVDGLTMFSEPSSAGVRKTLVISILIGIGMAYLIIGLWHLNKHLATIR